VWLEAHGAGDASGLLTHPRLAALQPLMVRYLASFKAPSTMWSYTYSWKRFRAFYDGVGARCIPADPLVVALYLTEVMAAANTFSVVRLASAAVSAFHHAVGLPSPTDAKIVHSIREAAERRLPDGANKKEPLELRHLSTICERFATPDCTLEDLMVCAAMSLAFFAFLRYADLAMLRVDWVLTYDHHLDLFLEERKTDQFRLGQWVVACAWVDSPACPVRLVRRLVERARLVGHRPLFSEVRDGAYASTKPIAYAKLRELFLTKFAAIGLDTTKFGTHSCRAGGATLAANNGVPDKLWMEHGGWRSARAAHGYVATAHSLKEEVMRAMLHAPPNSTDKEAGGPAAGDSRGPKRSRARPPAAQ
jgi:hypothetical protein